MFDRARELVKEIEEKVRRCDKCRGLGPINVDSKPYLDPEHNVYEKWVPERLECLFIAESRQAIPSASSIKMIKINQN